MSLQTPPHLLTPLRRSVSCCDGDDDSDGDGDCNCDGDGDGDFDFDCDCDMDKLIQKVTPISFVKRITLPVARTTW